MSREAMQQALDMLNEIADDVYCDQRVEGVIATLEQALEEKREPLTEATIRNICEHVPDYDISTHDLIQFARAIERAHGIKEKNG